jgi:uncharacterized membrane protein
MNNETPKKSSPIWILALIGVALVILGIVLLVNAENFKKNAVQAEATVTEIERYYDSDDEVQHSVYVEFYAGDEKVEGYLGYYDPTIKEGGKVTVYYNPADPTDFRNASSGIWTFVICIAIGGTFSFVGFLPLFKKKTVEPAKTTD